MAELHSILDDFAIKNIKQYKDKYTDSDNVKNANDTKNKKELQKYMQKRLEWKIAHKQKIA